MSDAIQVSMVKCADDTETRDIGVGAVLEAIRSGGKKKLRGQITQIRNRFESELAITNGDLKAAKREVEQLKKDLSGVTWSGRFSYRASTNCFNTLAYSSQILTTLATSCQRFERSLKQVRMCLRSSSRRLATD